MTKSNGWIWMLTVAAAMLLAQMAMAAEGGNSTGLALESRASVQGGDGSSMWVRTPFDFVVDGRTLQAGEYQIRQVRNGLLQIRDETGRGVKFVLTHAIDSMQLTGPKVVFRRNGDTYFLTEAWMSSASVGNEFPVMQQQKRKMAQKSAPDAMQAGR